MSSASIIKLVAAVAVLAWAYLPTLQFMADKWATDPQYSHGFLVPFFSAYLIYRSRLSGSPWTSTPRPLIGCGLLAVVAVCRWLAGGLLFHQLDAATMLVAVAGFAVAAGGWRLLRRTAPAVLFLAFMIPLPFEIERNVGGPLRTVATISSTFLLQTCGLPAVAEGNVILIDDVKLGVAEACSGLKMLLTFAAFSVGAVLLANRTLFERMILLLGIVPIAVLTNVLRVTAMGVAHTFVTDKATTDTLHDVFGWLMMPVGLGLLALELWVLDRLVVKPSA
jgi:exosortase